VRENVGRLLAMLFANLAQSGSPAGPKWAALQAKAETIRQGLVDRAPAAVARVQELSGGEESGAHDEEVRWMETVRIGSLRVLRGRVVWARSCSVVEHIAVSFWVLQLVSGSCLVTVKLLFGYCSVGV
jgi:hypothetical protein